MIGQDDRGEAAVLAGVPTNLLVGGSWREARDGAPAPVLSPAATQARGVQTLRQAGYGPIRTVCR
jgi:hypothetical protein